MGTVKSKATARGETKSELPPQGKASVRKRSRSGEGKGKASSAPSEPKAPNARDFMPATYPQRADVARAFGWAGGLWASTIVFLAMNGAEGLTGWGWMALAVFHLGIAMAVLGVVRLVRHVVGVTIGAARLTAIQARQRKARRAEEDEEALARMKAAAEEF